MNALTMPEYCVVDIGEDHLDAAYFLVRSIIPDLTREEWVNRARALRETGGIVGLGAPDGTLFGIMTFQKQQTLRHGPTLAIETLAVFELAGRGNGRRKLLEAARRAAGRLDCAAVAYKCDWRLIVEPVPGELAAVAARPAADR